jgi:curved DNA-binding protein CbpA
MADYYEILQVSPIATFDHVHKAYRALAMKYHPDRNSAPDAAVSMAAINEAYSVLSDPSRRRAYDRERVKSDSSDIAGPILRAAYDSLLKQGWAVAQSSDSMLVLEREFRSVHVHFVARADNAFLKRVARKSSTFSVVMAVELETPFNLSLTTAIIDLMRSQHYGAAFPDEMFRELFASFVS